jgi:hypothetical protein
VEVAVTRPAAFAIALALLLSFISQRPQQVPRLETLSLDSPLNHVAVIGDSYTTGTNEGGLGAKAWTARAWQMLGRQGMQVAADVASEGRAGYGVHPTDAGHAYMAEKIAPLIRTQLPERN